MKGVQSKVKWRGEWCEWGGGGWPQGPPPIVTPLLLLTPQSPDSPMWSRKYCYAVTQNNNTMILSQVLVYAHRMCLLLEVPDISILRSQSPLTNCRSDGQGALIGKL